MTVDDKREVLKPMTAIDVYAIEDELVCLLYELYLSAIDKSMPVWFRVTVETWFSLAERGLFGTVQDVKRLRNLVERNAEFDGDEIGRWHDSDELSA